MDPLWLTSTLHATCSNLVKPLISVLSWPQLNSLNKIEVSQLNMGEAMSEVHYQAVMVNKMYVCLCFYTASRHPGHSKAQPPAHP